MVMHASKYPRLNDGYYDRNKAHQYEDKYPSKNHSYTDRYNDRHESSTRERSPHSRYQNKQSYMERSRDRLQKGSSNSPAERRVNHTASSHGNDRRPGNDKKLSSSSSSKGSGRKDKPDIQKSALRICADWSEHLSSKGKKYYYNINTEESKWEKPKDWRDSQARLTEYGMAKEKERERQNGRDQSRHHLSSKYEHRSTHSGSSSEKRDSHQRLAKSFSTPVGAPVSSSSGGAHHHPPGSSRGSHHHPERANSMYSSSSSHSHSAASNRLQNDSSTRTVNSADHPHVSRTSKSGAAGYNAQSHRHSDTRRRGEEVVRRESGGYREDSREYEGRPPRGTGDHHRPHPGVHHHHSGRNDSFNSVYNDSAYNGSRPVDSHRNDNEDSRQSEDMDISPGSTPSNSRPGSRPSSRVSTPITSTPGASATPRGNSVNATGCGDKSPGGKQEGNLTQTIQQLQILQKVLMVQQQIQKQQQQQTPQQQQHHQQQHHPVHHHHHHHHHSSRHNTSGDGDESPMSEGTPTYEPQHLPPWECSGGGVLNLPGASERTTAPTAGKHSPRSDDSVRSRRSSPSRSDSSHCSVGGVPHHISATSLHTSSLAAATNKKQIGATLTLTPSLANYYKQHLIDHVQGWPSDTVEKSANQYAQEGHLVGSGHCTQVSVELKRARSLVRIAEIQSTLQEQRVLFLKQQIADLERSQNSYMPPSSSSDT